jgi:hypothetical protein
LDLSLRFTADEQRSHNTVGVTSSANSYVGGAPIEVKKAAQIEPSGMAFTLLRVEIVPISSSLSQLTVRVRASNQGPYSDAFADTHSSLTVRGEELLPQGHFNYRVLSGESREAELKYRVPNGAMNALLRLRRDLGDEVKFPLVLRAAAATSGASSH